MKAATSALLFLLCLGWLAGADEPMPAEVEKVFISPEKYEGKTVRFDKVKLLGDLEKKKRPYHYLTVTSEGGKKVTGVLRKDEGFTFTAEHEMAMKLLDETDPGKEHLVRLTCQIEKVKGLKGHHNWLARVRQVDFYTRTGQIRKTIKETPGQEPEKKEPEKK